LTKKDIDSPQTTHAPVRETCFSYFCQPTYGVTDAMYLQPARSGVISPRSQDAQPGPRICCFRSATHQCAQLTKGRDTMWLRRQLLYFCVFTHPTG